MEATEKVLADLVLVHGVYLGPIKSEERLGLPSWHALWLGPGIVSNELWSRLSAVYRVQNSTTCCRIMPESREFRYPGKS